MSADQANLNENRPLLNLFVHWGDQLACGVQLLPMFRFYTKLRSRPSIVCGLDPRLPEEHWKTNPEPERTPDGDVDDPRTGTFRCWTFYETLILSPKTPTNKTAVYALDLQFRFEEPINGRNITYVYRKTLRIRVPGEDSGSDTEIVIEGAEQVVLRNTSIYKHIKLINIGSGGVNISQTPEGLFSPEEKKEDESPIHECNIYPKENFFDSSFLSPTRRLLLKTTAGERVQYHHLLALPDITIGRSSDADIVYRFCGDMSSSDAPESFLSQLISRLHCSFHLKENGISFLDKKSSMGTELLTDNERINLVSADGGRAEPVFIPWEKLRRRTELVLAHVGTLELNIFDNSSFTKQLEPILRENDLLYDTDEQFLWTLGESSAVDVLRVTRGADLVHTQKENQQAILERLRGHSERINLFLENAEKWRRVREWKMDTFAEETEYFLMLRTLVIGNDRRLAQMFFDSKYGVRSGHALLFFCDDCFGFYNRDGKAVSWRSDSGQSGMVYKNDILILSPGLSFELGSVLFEVVE